MLNIDVVCMVNSLSASDVFARKELNYELTGHQLRHLLGLTEDNSTLDEVQYVWRPKY